MEEEPSKVRQLFCPVENKPMSFKIMFTDDLLNVEVQRVLKHIDHEGGEFEGFDLDDSKHIVLASKKYKPPGNQTVFNIRYVKRCVKEKKLLSLKDFQLSGEKFSGQRCFPFEKLVEAKRCPHLLTAKEVLKEIRSLIGPKQVKPKENLKTAFTEMMENRGKRKKKPERETKGKPEEPKKTCKNAFKEMMENRERNKTRTAIPKETHRDEILTENSRKRKRETETETERRNEKELETEAERRNEKELETEAERRTQREPEKEIEGISTIGKVDLAAAHLLIKKKLALLLAEGELSAK